MTSIHRLYVCFLHFVLLFAGLRATAQQIVITPADIDSAVRVGELLENEIMRTTLSQWSDNQVHLRAWYVPPNGHDIVEVTSTAV